MATEQDIERAILDLLRQRAPGKTICPSEAARRVDPVDWRPLMEPTRSVAQRLVEAGRLEVTQKGEPVDLGTVKGPIRLRLSSDADATT